MFRFNYKNCNNDSSRYAFSSFYFENTTRTDGGYYSSSNSIKPSSLRVKQRSEVHREVYKTSSLYDFCKIYSKGR